MFQDTVVGLQAFEELAELIYSTDVDMRIEILALSNETLVVCKSFDLTEENHDVLQLQDVRNTHTHTNYMFNTSIKRLVNHIWYGLGKYSGKEL